GVALFNQIGSVFWPTASLNSWARALAGFGSGNGLRPSLSASWNSLRPIIFSWRPGSPWTSGRAPGPPALSDTFSMPMSLAVVNLATFQASSGDFELAVTATRSDWEWFPITPDGPFGIIAAPYLNLLA